ncbi:ABC transporter substrate-binding protein [Corynebacterium cystitidis]|uniref:ABC transporter substrate-binding protein n=1 Tax=Corynebacterium cystitidis TaxID=35757 RepID=UPI00211ECDB6|nr:ABC transporter substrate-binding protein [Corynebacterium cystitidis]
MLLSRRALAVVVTGLLALSSVACSSDKPNAGSSTSVTSTVADTTEKDEATSEAGPVTITDVTGTTVELEKPFEKAVVQLSGSGGPLLTMAALDRENYTSKIAAMDDGLKKNRHDLWELLVEANPELDDIPIIGDVNKDEVTAEQLLTLGVDGIIVPVRQKAKMDIIAERAGIPVLYVDYHAQQLDTHIQSTKVIAEATGLTNNVEAITDFYTDVVGDIEKRAANLDRSTTAYIEIGHTGPSEMGNSYGSEMMWGSILDSVGADNIATEFLAPSDATPLTEEQVLVSDPDTIILAGSIWPDNPESVKMGFAVSEQEALESLAPYREREGWDRLTAIQNNELYGIGHALTRDMLDFYSYAVLAKLFHPEEFSDIDPEALMEEYFDKFMPIDYQGTWFVKYDG